MESPKTTSDPFRDQIRAAKAEGELAAIKDALAEFAEGNGFNPELEPRELLDKASGAFRSRAAISDMRYDEIRRLKEEIEAMRPRLVPEGMEWLLEVWPKWSNGEYCKFGDWWTADKYGDYEQKQLRRLVFYTPEQLREWEQDEGDNFGYEWDFMRPSDTTYRPDKSEPPAPKVTDADGVEIRVGDTVWPKYPSADRSEQVKRAEVVGIQAEYGRVDVKAVYATGMSFREQIDADRLTHRAPVIAADGKPLEARQTVWTLDDPIFECVVLGFGNGMVHLKSGADHLLQRNPSLLTHERPESWERLEEDARSIARDIVWNLGNWSPSDFENVGDDVQARVLDLVHRAMALAGVE